MALKIIFRKKAEKQLDHFTAMGERLFGSKVAQKFYHNVLSDIHLLANNPQLGAIEPLLEGRSRSYRSLLVHKHFKLIYYINANRNTLYLIAMWDTRREPGRLTAGIK